MTRRARLPHARHEAAHAVMAWLLGHRCRLNLIGDRINDGWCEITSPRYPKSDRLLVCLAGPIESTRHDRWAWTRVAYSTDLLAAVDLAADLAADPGQYLAEACDFVLFTLAWRRSRRALETLARELIRRGTLDEAAVDRIIAEAFAAPPIRQRPARQLTLQ